MSSTFTIERDSPPFENVERRIFPQKKSKVDSRPPRVTLCFPRVVSQRALNSSLFFQTETFRFPLQLNYHRKPTFSLSDRFPNRATSLKCWNPTPLSGLDRLEK